VHTNSGIPNKAFADLALALGGHAWEKAGRIWYETLRDPRVRPDATFQLFAERTMATTRRVFGVGSPEANAVAAAWEGVGVSTA
jgi:Zn-dependent metalloprotease